MSESAFDGLGGVIFCLTPPPPPPQTVERGSTVRTLTPPKPWNVIRFGGGGGVRV